MDQAQSQTFDGGCTCRKIRYRLTRSPIIVHGCHCRWCQRETGTAFAQNAMIETQHVELSSGQPERINTPTNSGKGQIILRCPDCKVAVWSHYAGAGEKLSFVTVGSLDEPDLLPPDIHIFTASKQAWVILPPEVPAFEAYYRRSEQLSAESLERLAKLAD